MALSNDLFLIAFLLRNRVLEGCLKILPDLNEYWTIRDETQLEFNIESIFKSKEIQCCIVINKNRPELRFVFLAL
jgi:hypothetical protein